MTKDMIAAYLLLGKHIIVKKQITFKPATIEQILEIGWEKFLQYTNIFSIKPSTVLKNHEELDVNTTWELVKFLLKVSPDFKEDLIEGLNFMLEEEVYFDNFSIIFEKDNAPLCSLDEDIFNDIKRIVAIQMGYIELIEEEEENPLNDMAARLLKRRKEVREQVAKAKAKENQKNDDFYFSNLLLDLCAKNTSGINETNISSLTFFAVQKHFSQLLNIESYNNNLLALVNGADAQITHWTERSNS